MKACPWPFPTLSTGHTIVSFRPPNKTLRRRGSWGFPQVLALEGGSVDL